MVGVVAHQGGQIERHRKPGLALLQQVVVAAIGLLGRRKARELPHGPELAAVHVAVNAARVRELARRAQVAGEVEPLQVLGSVDRFDRNSADGRELALGRFHSFLGTPFLKDVSYPTPPLGSGRRCLFILPRSMVRPEDKPFCPVAIRTGKRRGARAGPALKSTNEDLLPAARHRWGGHRPARRTAGRAGPAHPPAGQHRAHHQVGQRRLGHLHQVPRNRRRDRHQRRPADGHHECHQDSADGRSFPPDRSRQVLAHRPHHPERRRQASRHRNHPLARSRRASSPSRTCSP